MQLLSTSDIFFLKVAFAGHVAYAAQHYLSLLSKKPIEPLIPKDKRRQKSSTLSVLPPTRSIKKSLSQSGKQCVIFYGSQTGTAEKLAEKLSKEARLRFGIGSIVADLEDFDYGDLASLSPDTIIVFLLATYGEGEPTDNAIAFEEYVRLDTLKVRISNPESPSTLQYAAFGLGNSSYQQYNSMIKRVDTALVGLGARRIGDVGLGDDGNGTLEDDFLAWKDVTLPLLAQQLGFSEKPYSFEATFETQESDLPFTAETFLGEPSRAHLRGRVKSPFTLSNPYPAPISSSRELFTASDRSCLHVEFDVSSSTMTYETGDHLAVNPVNSEREVERFLEVFGLKEKKDVEIRIRTCDPTIKVPIPSKTTYEAAARYYLAICSKVSRHFLTVLARFAPNDAAKSAITRLSVDSVAFHREVTTRRLNIAQLLQILASSDSWNQVPFSLLLENFGKLQPRYYSISSSSIASKKTISITAVVESRKVADCGHKFEGVSSSYLMALSQSARLAAGTEEKSAEPQAIYTHQITGPRGQYPNASALVSVRRSRFRLPKANLTPIIMIGPGTGVAPFRAFVQERSLHAKKGGEVGRIMLFYGCRRSDEDFVYKEEWEVTITLNIALLLDWKDLS